MSGNELKLLALIFMVLDHISPFIPIKLAVVFKFLSRFVIAVYAFLAAEGYRYTSSKKSYLRRLYGAATVMFFGNIIINRFFINNPKYYVDNSMFLSIAIAVSILNLLDKSQYHRTIYDKIKLTFLALLQFYTEGGIQTTIIVISYYKYKDDLKGLIKAMTYGFIFHTLVFMPLILGKEFSYLNKILAIPDLLAYPLTVLFTQIYNGKRGDGFLGKYTNSFFYIFYPLHLWTIAILTNFL